MTAAKVDETFSQSSWAQKAARQATRASLTDFDRFKVMVLKKERNRAIAKAVKQIKSTKKSSK